MNIAFWQPTISLTKKIFTPSTRKDGNSSRSLTEPDRSTSICAVGDKVPVGEFFWIPDGDMIGHDRDARHAQGDMDGGSVDVGCTLTVRGIENGYAIVRLDRPEIPCGAPAAIGTVFQIPIAKMAPWKEKLAAIREHENQRLTLARRYCN